MPRGPAEKSRPATSRWPATLQRRRGPAPGRARPRQRPRTRRASAPARLHWAALHLLRRARRTDPLTGVPPAQLSALSVLVSGPKTVGELAAAEQVRPPTMSRLVSEMERAGLARKEPDRGDGRVVR